VSDAELLNQATKLHNAGVMRISEGNLPEAEKLLWESLKMRSTVLGAMDPDVVATLKALFSVLSAQSKFENAHEIAALMLSIREQLVGGNHPDIAADIDRLARVNDLLGDSIRAVELYERAFLLREQYLKDLHPELAASLSNLAAAYEADGDFHKAEECYRRLLAACERIHGTAHAKTIDVLDRLLSALSKQQPDRVSNLSKKWQEMAALYHGEGRYSEAEIFYRRAIAKLDGTLTKEHFTDPPLPSDPPTPQTPERVLKLLKKATE
jgi:tetratricopeptide (TPR) repeat protein